MSRLEALAARTRDADLLQRTGVVRSVSSLVVESDGPDAALGEVCHLSDPRSARVRSAEVVALRNGVVTLLPHDGTAGLAGGWRVEASGSRLRVPVGCAMLGRIVDGLGRPLDARPLDAADRRETAGAPRDAVSRPRIARVLETGIRAIDALLPVGIGQRVGVFAGSGIGKSTLIGHVARHARADAHVIALVGERGREVREFIEKHLTPQARARSTIVVATADEPALVRIQAAYTAVTLAEALRDQGMDVVLTLDSVTRVAMARREVGIASGEPATARGYTPSVFAELPRLCERCGTSAGGGAITALFTVLVDGDDHDEPVADALRSILDGHIVLSRALAQRGHFPPIDVLRSLSRPMPDITTAEEHEAATRARAHLALLDRNRDLVDIGAYVHGSQPSLDAALALEGALEGFLRQSSSACSRAEAVAALRSLLGSTA